jgi:hypothetical protein
VYLGCLARVLHDFTGATRRRLLAIFPYTRMILLSAAGVMIGIVLTLPLVSSYIQNGLSLPDRVGFMNHEAVTGLLLVIAGFWTFVFTLLLHAATKLANKCFGTPR